jgi:hypothetical protein
VSDIDWPLALTLAAVFVVMSLLRWRYFMSARRRWNRPRGDRTSPDPGPSVDRASHQD